MIKSLVLVLKRLFARCIGKFKLYMLNLKKTNLVQLFYTEAVRRISNFELMKSSRRYTKRERQLTRAIDGYFNCYLCFNRRFEARA